MVSDLGVSPGSARDQPRGSVGGVSRGGGAAPGFGPGNQPGDQPLAKAQPIYSLIRTHDLSPFKLVTGGKPILTLSILRMNNFLESLYSLSCRIF